MRTIWKFPLLVTKVTTVEAPRTAKVALVALDPDSGAPAVWLELDPEAARIERLFEIQPTGGRVEGDGGFPDDIHVGSVVDRTFVWHVYERRS